MLKTSRASKASPKVLHVLRVLTSWPGPGDAEANAAKAELKVSYLGDASARRNEKRCLLWGSSFIERSALRRVCLKREPEGFKRTSFLLASCSPLYLCSFLLHACPLLATRKRFPMSFQPPL